MYSEKNEISTNQIKKSDDNNNVMRKPEGEPISTMIYKFLDETKQQIPSGKTTVIPIAELSTLGAGLSSLIPSLRTITQTTVVNTDGLLRVANAGAGDALKIAKDGNFWGAMKTATGASKMAKFTSVVPVSATSTSVMPINPATLMMAAALLSIEKKLGEIERIEKEILAFLADEKHAEIEADVETLTNLIERYRTNWDNEQFIRSNHKQVIDIQRTALKNMLFYEKKVEELVNAKQFLVSQAMVTQALNDFMRKFRYYRLSLYTYSLAEMLEVMLSGNFTEENISERKVELESYSWEYRKLYSQGSIYLEKMTKSSIETNVMKGLGNAEKSIGKLIGSIPVVKEGPVDELLQDNGRKIKGSAREVEQKTIKSFSGMGDPKTSAFTHILDSMIRIYNHTSEILIDRKNIYLVADGR